MSFPAALESFSLFVLIRSSRAQTGSDAQEVGKSVVLLIVPIDLEPVLWVDLGMSECVWVRVRARGMHAHDEHCGAHLFHNDAESPFGGRVDDLLEPGRFGLQKGFQLVIVTGDFWRDSVVDVPVRVRVVFVAALSSKVL